MQLLPYVYVIALSYFLKNHGTFAYDLSGFIQ